MREHACCFTGHRMISAQDRPALEYALRGEIRRLYESGVTEFYAGGAVGFDMLAENAVLELREELPIHLHLMLPCKDQHEKWPAKQQKEYGRILELADSVRYISEEYTDTCMLCRNDAMVEAAEYCICFLKRKRGGTAYTVNRAKKAGCTVIQLLTYETEQLEIPTVK